MQVLYDIWSRLRMLCDVPDRDVRLVLGEYHQFRHLREWTGVKSRSQLHPLPSLAYS